MNIERYRVKEGEKVDLSQYATACDVDIDKKKVKKELNGKLMFILRSDMSRIVKIKVVMYVFAHPLYVRYIKKKHA